MSALGRAARRYGAIAAMTPKLFLAYSLWVWIGLLLNLISMAVFYFFWRAVYAQTPSLGGLAVGQTITYILMVRVFEPLGRLGLIWDFGFQLREGAIAHILLRPLDVQGSWYVGNLAGTVGDLIMQMPIALAATLLFGLAWPTDPAVWGAFVVAAILGRTVLFLFEWTLASLAFYTTEVWGLGVLFQGLALFFSGGLVPLDILPAWLRTAVQLLPFSQAVYVPMSILSGVAPLSAAPQLWLGQLAWLLALVVVSRAVFAVAVRQVTVQGG
jgi:ABC-2 type transport system permease protein